MLAAQNEAAFKLACEDAQKAFDGLEDANKSWCKEALNKLRSE